ncbi:MAG TPA: sigma-70 family RNA polymerase sigma factor [Gemmataceae bacterium]|nr:sigma-70 family RNA polymerase sigma factor [Gemmataceae bacterium]
METSPSLLERLCGQRDEEAWRRLDDLYRPLVRSWLRRDPSLGAEIDDLVQEVMSVLVRELPGFHRQRTGSFRRWLREITVHRLQAYYRERRRRPRSVGPEVRDSPLAQLSDPRSDLSHLWDEDHDRHVLRRLLQLIEPQFQPNTLTAFRRVVFDERPPAEVARELGLSVNAVLLAKSRVLAKLRQEAEGFLD